MSLNSIPVNFHFCLYQGPKLKEETIRKLISLGINPNTVSSEAQAQSLISQIENTQAVKETTNESSSKNTLTAEENLKKKKENEVAIFQMFEMDANINKLLFKL